MKELKKSNGIKMRGFSRVQIVNPDGSIAGDSGLMMNQIQNEGFDDYGCRLLGALANSKQLSHIALGTGTLPGVTVTQLTGEIMASTERKTFTPTVNASKTLQIRQTFASVDSFLTLAQNLSNIGLYDSSNAGTLFAANTYTSSSCNTNQNVNVTYDIQFS